MVCTYAHVHKELYAWLIGVTLLKTDDFVAILASIVDSKQTSSVFFAVFDGLVTVTMHSRANNCRCGVFRADDNDNN